MIIHTRNLLFLLGLPLIAAALSGCGGGGGYASASINPTDYIYTREEAEVSGNWTILVYLDADNDLENAAINNFNQMEVCGSTKNVKVIVQIDRAAGYDTSNDDWTDTRRYLVTKNSNSSTIASVRLDDTPLGELDMADPDNLKDFVDWGVSNFPAEHYCLIIWDHGSGWSVRSATSKYKAVISDETSGHVMNVTDISAALADVHLDVVAFDACLMQQLEVAYELKDSADYLVGSSAPEPSPGYNYATLLSDMNACTTPAALCKAIVSDYVKTYPDYNGITQSAVDLGKISAVAEAADNFADVLMASDASTTIARNNTLDYSTVSGGSEYYSLDLMDYARRCTNAVGESARTAYNGLQSAVADAIVSEAHNSDTPDACGLAIYMPTKSSYDSRYGMLGFAQTTAWDEWIQSQK
jgi:hypothetical protein